jgi:hypothetical protein
MLAAQAGDEAGVCRKPATVATFDPDPTQVLRLAASAATILGALRRGKIDPIGLLTTRGIGGFRHERLHRILSPLGETG